MRRALQQTVSILQAIDILEQNEPADATTRGMEHGFDRFLHVVVYLQPRLDGFRDVASGEREKGAEDGAAMSTRRASTHEMRM